MYARIYAKWLPRYIPGAPHIVVENRPGGNGMMATNYLYGRAKPDGLTLSMVTNGDISLQMQESEGVQYDVTKMPILSASVGGQMLYVNLALTNIKQRSDVLKTKTQIISAASSIGAPMATFQHIFMLELLGIKSFRLTVGWKSAGDRRIAFERGEINACAETVTSYTQSIKPLVDGGKAMVLFQSGIPRSDGAIVRAKVLSDVPTVEEFYKELFGKAPSGIAWEAIKQQIMSSAVDKTLSFPPNTPSAVVEEMRNAVNQLWRNPEWLKETERILGFAHTPPQTLTGDEAGKIVKSLLNPPKEVKEYLQKWIETHSK